VRLESLKLPKISAGHAQVEAFDERFEILQALRAVGMDNKERFEPVGLGVMNR